MVSIPEGGIVEQKRRAGWHRRQSGYLSVTTLFYATSEEGASAILEGITEKNLNQRLRERGLPSLTVISYEASVDTIEVVQPPVIYTSIGGVEPWLLMMILIPLMVICTVGVAFYTHLARKKEQERIEEARLKEEMARNYAANSTKLGDELTDGAGDDPEASKESKRGVSWEGENKESKELQSASNQSTVRVSQGVSFRDSDPDNAAGRGAGVSGLQAEGTPTAQGAGGFTVNRAWGNGPQGVTRFIPDPPSVPKDLQKLPHLKKPQGGNSPKAGKGELPSLLGGTSGYQPLLRLPSEGNAQEEAEKQQRGEEKKKKKKRDTFAM